MKQHPFNPNRPQPQRSTHRYCALGLLLLGATATDAASWKSAYRAGDYTNAFTRLQPLVESAPDQGTYNRACVRYRQKEFLAAEKLFGESATQTEDETLKQNALYNRGTALLASSSETQSNLVETIAQSIECFEQALELQPDDLDAKQNMERALDLMINGRLYQAKNLIEEADQLLTQNQAKKAQENYTESKKTISPVLDDFSPGHSEAVALTERADRQLHRLELALTEAKEDLKNAKHAIDMYEYVTAATVMTAEKPTRIWAFDLDQNLAQEFQQLIQNNKNVIDIVAPTALRTP